MSFQTYGFWFPTADLPWHSACPARAALIPKDSCFRFIQSSSLIAAEIAETNFRRIVVKAKRCTRAKDELTRQHQYQMSRMPKHLRHTILEQHQCHGRSRATTARARRQYPPAPMSNVRSVYRRENASSLSRRPASFHDLARFRSARTAAAHLEDWNAWS